MANNCLIPSPPRPSRRIWGGENPLSNMGAHAGYVIFAGNVDFCNEVSKHSSFSFICVTLQCKCNNKSV